MKGENEDIVYTASLTICMIALGVVLLSMLGCTSRGELAVEQQKIAAMNRPLFDMQCPATGCVVSSLTVHNPEQIKLPKETNAWDTVNKLLAVVATLAPEAKAAYIAGEFLKSAISKNHTETHNTTTDSYNTTTNDETHTTDSGNTTTNDETHIADSYNETHTTDNSAESYDSSVTSTDTTTTNTTTTTTTTTDNSDNSERNNATDSSF